MQQASRTVPIVFVQGIDPVGASIGHYRGRIRFQFGLVARSRNRTSAARSSAEPMRCSGILVPGV